MPSLSSVILRGTRAVQPAANSVAEGALYYVTDENLTERSNGSTWDSYNDSSGAGTDHGLLTGLTDDDHPQYLLASSASSRAEFANFYDSVDANTTQEPWEFILPGTGISVTIEGDAGSVVRLAADTSVVVTKTDTDWVDLTDGGATTLHSHSGGSYDSTVPGSLSDFVDASDTNEPLTDMIQAGSGVTITETGTRGAISIAASGSGALTLVQAQTLTAGGTDITFSGLDGNTDGVYSLHALLKVGANTTTITLLINGATTNLSCKRIYGNGGTASSDNTANFIATANTGAYMMLDMIFMAKANPHSQTFHRLFHGRGVLTDSTPDLSFIIDYGYEYKDSSTNITSIALHADTAGGIADGSYANLYKYAQS